MAMHTLPSGRMIGPGGRLYKGGNRRRYIVSSDGPSVPNSGGTIGSSRSSRSGPSRSAGRRSGRSRSGRSTRART